MLAEYLENTVLFQDRATDWEASIRTAAAPLLDQGYIKDSYIEDMIGNVHEFGSYIVIMPGVAMPHAQNTGAVIKNGISLMKLETPVVYPEEKPVSLVFVLAATDSDGHLGLIADLSTVLGDEEIKERLEQAATKEEILRVIKEAEEEE